MIKTIFSGATMYQADAQAEPIEIRVYGHKMRCESLSHVLYNDLRDADITIVDIAAYYNPFNDQMEKKLERIRLDDIADDFLIEITDVPKSALEIEPDVVINYQIGAEKQESEYKGVYPNAKLLLGKDYFFSSISMGRWTEGFVDSGYPSVIVIPNGNKHLFFQQLNINHVQGIVNRSGGAMTVVNHLPKMALLDYLSLSAVVITTPSVTAMECLAIGLPVLLIQTSEDQTGKFTENDCAWWYSNDVLSYLLNSKTARMAMARKAREFVTNNYQFVSDIIKTEYENKKRRNKNA